jgi:hypothetical protein
MVSLNYIFSLYVNFPRKVWRSGRVSDCVPKYAGSLPSVVTFEIFLLCRSFFASSRIRSGVFHEASLD